MTNISQVIEVIKEQQRVIEQIIFEIQSNWGNEEAVLGIFLSCPSYCFAHPKVVSLFADYLQTINTETVYSTFALDDILALYQFNLKTLPEYATGYVDVYYFQDTIFGDRQGALNVLNDGLEKVKSQQAHIEALMKVD